MSTLSSRSITFWTDPTNRDFIPPLRALLEGASGSLKTLFADCDLAGFDVMHTLWRFLAGLEGTVPEELARYISSQFAAARSAAVTKHKWDFGKGPHLYLPRSIFPTGDDLQLPRRVTITSRCMTIEAELALVNVKFPAVPGEANQHRLRVRIVFNPHDSKQAALFDAALLSLGRREDVQFEEPLQFSTSS